MNATTLPVGAKVKIKFNGGVEEAAYVGPHSNADYGIFEINGKQFPRSFNRVASLNAGWMASVASTPTVEAVPAAPDVPVYDVNRRFTFIESMVDMVVRGSANSLVVTGSGGLGKSYTVFNRLKLNDLGDADYERVSGHMTPKALYRKLHDSNDRIVVFDDCDSVLTNELSANLLKSALDSYGNRVLCWASEMGGTGDLPGQFNFSGRVVFISNFSLVDIPQPIISRALYVDVTMTVDEKIERIRAISGALCPDLSATAREECLDLIANVRHRVSDLNLRTMMKVAAIRRANPNTWRDISTYMITARLGGRHASR